MTNDERLYLGNPLNQFENGVQLDLRAKLAIKFIEQLCTGEGGTELHATDTVRYAMDLASAVLEQAGERGWLKDLSDSDDLPASLRRHIRQNTRAQVYQQIVGQKIAEEEQPKVATAPNMRPVPIGPRKQ